ncbi:uncharacterized protein TNCV_1241041 [Trichonephila clavipes]|uniref:Uncharacterized protein n=1 Tax=Trichonephila clavipes TaxID=2585209 RepID=A0A8X6WF56_TRICX|nr:uncharacterized protein TNCV_1241041 [Trichonephila clavipes]
MIVQFRNEKVSNHGSIPITIDCNVVAFIAFEEGFHQPIKRTKQSVFLDFNAQQLFRVRLKVTGKPKVYVTNHKEENTDVVQSIPGFQECNEYVVTWMVCDAEDCGSQMLNDDGIVTCVQEESDTVNDETDEDKDNNNESRKVLLNADVFSALETAME